MSGARSTRDRRPAVHVVHLSGDAHEAVLYPLTAAGRCDARVPARAARGRAVDHPHHAACGSARRRQRLDSGTTQTRSAASRMKMGTILHRRVVMPSARGSRRAGSRERLVDPKGAVLLRETTHSSSSARQTRAASTDHDVTAAGGA